MSRINNVAAYNLHHVQQRHDAINTLRQYNEKLNWKNCSKILDIGCGPGDLTANILLPLIPDNGHVTGGDISTNMIAYAKSKYLDKRLKFEIMDIVDSSHSKRHENEFDMIFSFYCLHWVQDQRNAMNNIYTMLKPGGEFLAIFLGYNPIYTVYELLSANSKWSQYIKGLDDIKSPYHHSKDPVSKLRNLLEVVGFEIIDLQYNTTTYTFPTYENLEKNLKAVDPFINQIPENLINDYTEDYKEIVIGNNFCQICEKTEAASYDYSLFIVHAKKKLNLLHTVTDKTSKLM